VTLVVQSLLGGGLGALGAAAKPAQAVRVRAAAQ
jgi:hypothetical protein